MKDRSSLFWALVLIALGTIFLLENLELLDFSFSRLWKFWPLILIYLGIKTVSGESKQASLITFVLGLVLVGWLIAAGLKEGKTDSTDDSEEESTEESFFDEFEGDIQLERNATLSDEAKNPVLKFDLNRADGTFKLKEGEENNLSCSASGNKATMSMEEPSDSSQTFTVQGNTSGSAGENDAAIYLAPNKPWAVDGRLGYSEAKLNFSKVKLSSLKLDLLRGENNLVLGSSATDTLQVVIHAENASVNLKVPADVKTRVSVEQVSGTQNIEKFDALSKQDGQELFESKPSQTNRRFINIRINGEVKNLRMSVY